MADEDWDSYGFVRSSQHRQQIIELLAGSPEVPSVIADRLDMRSPHVSNSLSEMSERNLVECVNPDRKKGRVYRLTSKGKWVFNKLKD